MPSWKTILSHEQTAVQQIKADSAEDVTLFSNFSPNPGGQTHFCNLMGLLHTEVLAHRWGALIGGLGAGKSYIGAVWTIARALLAPECRGLVAANTFGQLSRSSLITLVEVCRQYNVSLYPYRESVEDNALAIANLQRCYIGKNKAFLYVLSMNSFTGQTQAARGLQIRFAWLDEAAYAAEKAFLTLDGRLGRGPGSLKGQGIITTTACGFNWVYDRFADPLREPEKQRLYVMVACPTKENVAYLGEDYVFGLEASYTEELAAQELDGQFVNTMSGLIYKYFVRSQHALSGQDAELLDYDSNLPLLISFDFNSSPCIALFAQRRKDEIHVFKEFFLLDSDLWQLTDEVAKWIKLVGHQRDIEIFGDATGAARTAQSKLTSWDIVFDALRSVGFTLTGYPRLHKKFDKINPLVINRINSVNCLCKQNRLYIKFEECKKLVKDLETLNYSGEGIDKSDPLLSHLSDALGYLLHRLYPYRAAAKKPGGNYSQLKGLAA